MSQKATNQAVRLGTFDSARSVDCSAEKNIEDLGVFVATFLPQYCPSKAPSTTMQLTYQFARRD